MNQFVLIDLMGLKSHANFVTSLYQSCKTKVSHICATKDAIDWRVVDDNCLKKTLYLNAFGLKKFITFLYVCSLFILRKRNLLISGSTTYWHLAILLLSSPKKINLIVHNEFHKVHKASNLGAKVLKLFFKIYRIRGFKFAVMSNVMRDAVVKENLYSEKLLYVITHPLPENDNKTMFSKEGSINMLGFLRPQKLHGAKKFFNEMSANKNAVIRIFGKYSNLSDIIFLKPFCNEFKVQKHDYNSDEEKAFLSAHPCYCIAFFPNETYELLTSGSVIDAVRIGCYCIMPSPSKMAKELIGSLVIDNIEERLDDPDMIIKSLIQERKDLNYRQIVSMVSSYNYSIIST